MAVIRPLLVLGTFLSPGLIGWAVGVGPTSTGWPQGPSPVGAGGRMFVMDRDRALRFRRCAAT